MDKALFVLDVPQPKSIWDTILYGLCQQHGIELAEEQNFTQLTGHLVRHVLPFLSKEAFVKVMRDFGAMQWVEAEIGMLTEDESKLLLVQVVEEPKLESLLLSYFTAWEYDKRKFPRHIFRLGLGHRMSLNLVNHTSEVMYHRQMSYGNYVILNPVPPELALPNNYTFSNEDFIEMTYTGTKLAPYDVSSLTQESLFYVKLVLATNAAEFNRWSECWAHGLSALDMSTMFTPCFHDVMCILAKSSGMSSLYKSIPTRLLKLARLHGDTAVDHIWQRLLVLHQLCIHWGFFILEEDVFQFCNKIFPKQTELYHNLLRQHLKSLMIQIENIILFQSARKQYHADCTNSDLDYSCDKEPLLHVSFLQARKLLEKMEKLIDPLSWPGEKEYYTAIMMYYSTFHTEITEPKKRSAANFLLQVAQDNLKITDHRFYDAKIILDCENNTVDYQRFVIDEFSPRTFSKFNPECAETMIRGLVFLSMNTQVFTLRMISIAADVEEYYSAATHSRGYRIEVLRALRKTIEGSKSHDARSQPDLDYPIVDRIFNSPDPDYDQVCTCFQNEKNMYHLRVEDEFKRMQPEESAPKRRRLEHLRCESPFDDIDILSSQLLFGMDKLGEQVYAFGYYTQDLLTQKNQ